ncbi:MAG: TetR/AcrR family transcriptional regulator [Acidimicrobiia bacterium]|nr:TetR/AcrR family transcriptional regulator [Acidimicrobiia bacterium]
MPAEAASSDQAASRREARRRAQNELSREHVLDAAEEVFSRKGFHDATIKEIALVAEFSVGAVYSFFENKDDLFLSVIERRGDELVPAMRDLLDGAGTPVEQLHALADLQVGFFREHPSFSRLYLQATGSPLFNVRASLGKVAQKRYEMAMNLEATFFEAGQEAGAFVDGDPGALAEIFSGIIRAYQATDPAALGDDPTGGPRFAMDDLHALLDRAFVVS